MSQPPLFPATAFADLARSIIGKGHKPAEVPLPVPVLRAVKDACDGRQAGPLRSATAPAAG